MGPAHNFVLCGAIALGFGEFVIVARSPRRYKWPACRIVDELEALAASMTVTCCAAELGTYIQHSLKSMRLSRPCRDPGVWSSRSHSGYGVLTGARSEGESLSLRFESGLDLHLRYRLGLDGSITVCIRNETTPLFEQVVIGSIENIYGWLRPDSAYRVLWGGRQWPSAYATWSGVTRRLPASHQKRSFLEIYRARLTQHPVMFRRFQHLRKPISWPEQHAFGEWINELCISDATECSRQVEAAGQ